MRKTIVEYKIKIIPMKTKGEEQLRMLGAHPKSLINSCTT